MGQAFWSVANPSAIVASAPLAADAFPDMPRANLDVLDGRCKDAPTTLDKPIALESADFGFRVVEAGVAASLGDGRGAHAAPHEAVNCAPRDGMAANAAGAVLLRANQVAEPTARIDEAVEQDDAIARYRFDCRKQFDSGTHAATRQLFREETGLRPGWLDAHARSVQLALEHTVATQSTAPSRVEDVPEEPRSGLFFEAQTAIGRAVADQPGLALIEVGKYAEAAQVLKSANRGVVAGTLDSLSLCSRDGASRQRECGTQGLRFVSQDGAVRKEREAAQQLSQESGT